MARTRSHLDKRTRLISAAVGLAYQNGFGATSLADIAREAKVPNDLIDAPADQGPCARRPRPPERPDAWDADPEREDNGPYSWALSVPDKPRPRRPTGPYGRRWPTRSAGELLDGREWNVFPDNIAENRVA
jgi:hypothetical protein